MPRYAIYFTPPRESALCRFGARVIGYDSYDPHGAAPSRLPGLAAILQAEHLAEPARYGFHATLRAPFELGPQRTKEDLVAHARSFAASRPNVPIGDLAVTRLSSFIALVCVSPPTALAELAEACVRHFEPLRAPLSPADRARRLAAPLTPRQRAHLDDWGYPYVLDDFTFHMTLTGRLVDATGAAALAAIGPLHAAVSAPVTIDAITVLEQPARNLPFHVVARFDLAGTPS